MPSFARSDNRTDDQDPRPGSPRRLDDFYYIDPRARLEHPYRFISPTYCPAMGRPRAPSFSQLLDFAQRQIDLEQSLPSRARPFGT